MILARYPLISTTHKDDPCIDTTGGNIIHEGLDMGGHRGTRQGQRQGQGQRQKQRQKQKQM